MSNTTALVSIGTDGPADGFSYTPSSSADGTKIAFHSGASNLVAGDTNGREDIFVRTLLSATGSVTEDFAPDASGALTAAGMIDVPGVTPGAALSATVAFTAATHAGGQLGSLSASGAIDGGAEGPAGWAYTVSNAAVQFLAAGQQIKESYEVSVDDGQGVTASESVTVTITGVNDVPTLLAGSDAGGRDRDGADRHDGQPRVEPDRRRRRLRGRGPG